MAGYAPATVRARIGLILPSSNRMAEPHFCAHAPAGVVTHATRLRMTGAHALTHDALMPQVAGAAALLADAKCDAIAFHCTANSMAEGVEGDRRIAATLAQATGRKVTTTAAATLAALRTLAARRLVLVSPYRRAAHQHEIDFLSEAGFEIVAERNLDMRVSDDYCTSPPALWRDVLTAMRDDRADAYFASCANIRAIDVVEELERTLGRPVLTSNQVVLWLALRLAGIDDAVPGIGCLLREPVPATAA